MLAGAVTAAAPIIIHLLNRRRFKVIAWAAMEFLLASSRKNFRRLKLQEVILLVLRTLVLLLVAAALARPFLAGAASVLGKSQRYAVILIDNSFSMGYSVANDRPFDRAAQFAEKIVDSLAKGDLVSVIAVSDRAHPIIREPSIDSAAARSEIKVLPLSQGSTNLPDAFRMALDLVKGSRVTQKEVYLITDSQRAGWRIRGGKGSELDGILREMGTLAECTLVDVGLSSRENLAITDLQPRERIIAKELPDTSFIAKVTSFGETNQGKVEVSFFVDGYRQGSSTVSVRAGGSADVTFSHTFHDAAAHSLAVKLNPDHLAADDSRYLAVQVLDHAAVLLVDGKPSADPYQTATGYLQAALHPRDDNAFARSTMYQSKVIQPSELASAKFEDYEFVVLADVPRLDASIVSDLEAYVRSGGALVIFPGSSVEQPSYNQALYLNGLGLLPARLAGVLGDPKKQSFITLAVPPDSTHPLLKEFTRQKAAFLNLPQFYQYAQLEVPERDDTTVVCRFDKGRPGLVEKRFGRGRVLLFAFTANDAWTDFPRRPGFLLLMQEVAAYVARDRAAGRNLIVGDVYARSAGPEALVSKITVAGAGTTADLAAIPEGKRSRITFDGTDSAGIYDLKLQREGTVEQDCFSVNVDASESDLRRIGPEELKRLLPDARFRYFTGTTSLDRGIAAGANKSDFWKIFLLSALVLMCVESVLAQRFGR